MSLWLEMWVFIFSFICKGSVCVCMWRGGGQCTGSGCGGMYVGVCVCVVFGRQIVLSIIMLFGLEYCD